MSDPEKRKKYDKYGKDWKHAEQFEKAEQQQQYQPGNYGNQQGTGDFSSDFSNFFESLFGSGEARSSQAKFRGRDVNAELHLSLKDAFTTQQQTLTVNGKNIRLTFPAGIEDGQVIKVAGHGSPGTNGGPAGDLYITFIIDNDTKFKREGSNLYTTVELDVYTALLGGEIMADTFDGKVKLKISPGTQPGTKVKLKGKGFPVYKKEHEFGDLFISYQIQLPVHLSEKETALFRELQKMSIDGNK